MAEEAQGQAQQGQGQAQGQSGQDAGAQGAGAVQVTVKGAKMTKQMPEIIEAAQKHWAGETLLDKFSKDKQAWQEEQRETLNLAKFGATVKKALTERDPAALKETLAGLGVGQAEAEAQVRAWEAKMSGQQNQNQNQPAKGNQPTVENVLGQMAQALIAVNKQNQELVGRLEHLEGGFKTLDRRDLIRSEDELLHQVDAAIGSDDFHGHFAGKSPKYRAQLREDAAGILARRLQAGEKDVPVAIKSSLEEARARLENYSDAFAGRGGIPISGLPSRGSRNGLDAYLPKKPPEPVSPADPKYGQYLLEALSAALPDLEREARES